ncbi:MAG: hypothetical protein ACI8Z7_000289 [Candidatus Nanohaloarchaea archaeon]|jgi:hypothetical protein
MSRELTFRNFLEDLGMRITAALTVIGIFYGLGYIKRTDLLGLSWLIDTTASFFTAGFLLIGFAGASWILYQYRF